MSDATRVLSLPRQHPYVDHIGDLDPNSSFRRLPDVPVPGAPEGQWWPFPALRESWVENHADEFDLVHIHFGFESFAPEEITRWVSVLERHQRPLVYTVHDLENPHLRDQGLFNQANAVLIAAAAEVVTLTECAAQRIRRDFGREAEVIPHPHIVELHRIERVHRPPERRPVIGVELKSHRQNVRTRTAVEVAHAAKGLLDVVIGVHPDVLPCDDLDIAQALGADIWVHERLCDEVLWNHLESLEIAVLPYAWGTHSGWLEACRDLGTSVIAPDFGCYGGQGAATVPVGNEDALRGAIRRLLNKPDGGWTASQRRSQRRRIAARYGEIYRRALDSLGSATSY